MSTMPFLAPSASAEAAAIDAVLVSIHTHIVVLALGWGGLLLYTLFRFRRRAHPSPDTRGPGWVWPAIAIGAVIAGDVVILATSALPVWSRA